MLKIYNGALAISCFFVVWFLSAEITIHDGAIAADINVPYEAVADEQSVADGRKCALRSALAEAVASDPALKWSAIQAACDRQIDVAKTADPVGFSWFANAGNGFVGTPLVLLKVLPDLAPEIWGSEASFFSEFGLFRDPDEQNRILPRGLGVTSSTGRPLDVDGRPTGEIDYAKPGLYFVTLACGACHTGQIKTGEGHLTLEGAPNTQFDVRLWRQAFTDTLVKYLDPEQIGTKDAPGETAQKLIEIIDSKPAGYFVEGMPGVPGSAVAQLDALQRGIFKSNINAVLTGFANGTNLRSIAVKLQQRPGSSYGHGDRSPGLGGFSAGQSDGSGDLLVDLLAAREFAAGATPESFLKGQYSELPPFATVTDAPSVWNQADHSVGQWDGSVLSRFWRNIAAQLPIVGDPTKVDLTNTHIVAEFLLNLPSAPYPFDVDLAKAAKGEALFIENCGDCHRPRNDRQYWELQTDFNRAQVLTPTGGKLFLAAFQSACHDPDFTYVDRNGKTVRPCVTPASGILRDTTMATNQGYIASALDGIWARAPYLHNGSVPTLRHLLKPSTRPDSFTRGIIEYDRTDVGWIWQNERASAYAASMPTTSEFDTRRDGWSNGGHNVDLTLDGKTYRLDWSDPAYAEELDQLIEYLKTL